MTHAPVDAHEGAPRYVTAPEVEALRAAAKNSRYPERDELIMLMLYRHGLRESELCRLQRTWVKLDSAKIWIERIKGGLSTEHPIEGDELRLLRRFLRTRSDDLPWLFISERGDQLSRHTVIYIVQRCAELAGLPDVTPHWLRHGCGYYLANRGYDTRLIQDYLGHRDIKHTARYTRTASVRFKGLWI